MTTPKYKETFRLPFAEQIEFFKNKLNLPTDSYLDLEGKEHDYAFVVAGANRNDILADFRQAIDKAIIDGTTLDEFRKDFDDIVAKFGWDYNGGRRWRSRIIYDTNLYSSYNAGRYEQHQSMKDYRPYLQYVHRDGQKNPRPLHQSWDDLVLPADDPFWTSHYPINAYGCHCSVIAHSERSLKREGLSVGTSPKIEYVTKVLGKRSGNPKLVTLPEGIDYGFDRIPGTNRVDMPSKLLLDKAIAVPPDLAANMVGNVLQVAEVRALLNAEVKAMVDTVADEQLARGVSKSIGALPNDVVSALIEQDLTPTSAIITLRDTDVLKLIKDSRALPKSFLQNIADYLISPEAVLLDTTQDNPALLYVVDMGKGKGKAVISVIDNVISSAKPYNAAAIKAAQVLYGEVTS
ncbi:phage minor head protein [Psychrobacter sp. APC 3279]|uniref:phage head morphogenesis protein n=1 Tax=Psychrobacter sp. APC 3279 TaxID=3035189 RepID=UPI0025B32993|nr:phage minor head protein [Psychrobacter sp. APC 3279]MDN3441086.1 phage minor head protein [Psychrobacter sp. APC 3279]